MIDTPAVRDESQADILQQVQNEIEETLSQHAPQSWSEEQFEDVQEDVLDHTRMVLDALSMTELQSAGALRTHVAQAIAETKRLIHQGGVWRDS
jgi:hypothetical protein